LPARTGPAARARTAAGQKKFPGLLGALRQLLRQETAGDPRNGRKWVRHSVRWLAEALRRQGYAVSPMTVHRLLGRLGYALRANRKRFTGPAHPDRDRQFAYIAGQRQRFAIHDFPVISVDAKKKELIGNFKNPGRVWCRRAKEVNAHDFRDDALARAVPYGVYDTRRDRGYVYLGLAADTAQFAVDAIARWWRDAGRRHYPGAEELLILCDAGGSNSCRTRLWKQQVQEKLADRWGLTVTVCHYPRGASKWNPADHRLFSRISSNWAGQPLRSLETLLACVRGTQTQAGFAVRAALLPGTYEEGTKVPEHEVATWRLRSHAVCPQWNYTIKPRWAIY
jgi:Rhodopirellula transposase DDE domain